jgi:hypothetical protein
LKKYLFKVLYIETTSGSLEPAYVAPDPINPKSPTTPTRRVSVSDAFSL